MLHAAEHDGAGARLGGGEVHEKVVRREGRHEAGDDRLRNRFGRKFFEGRRPTAPGQVAGATMLRTLLRGRGRYPGGVLVLALLEPLQVLALRAPESQREVCLA